MQPDEDAILRAKLQDAIRLARQGSGAHFIGFLNERQAALAAQETEKMQFKNYLFWGGFCGAERVCFGAFPEWMELSEDAFPIETATATFRTDDHLTHRDFLGALMGTGVQRKVLGDILLESGRCVFFQTGNGRLFALTVNPDRPSWDKNLFGCRKTVPTCTRVPGFFCSYCLAAH